MKAARPFGGTQRPRGVLQSNMLARDGLHRMNGSADLFLVRPLVRMAARVLGPGPTRLKLVKLAHNLSTPSLAVLPEGFLDYGADVVEPASRAA